MSLQGLSTARLIELRGLKERCSAPLRCVAHGLALPCDLCDLDGSNGMVCEVCGHHYPQGLLGEGDRACQSSTEFLHTGKIAFADEAKAALSALELARQRTEAADQRAAERVRLERECVAREEGRQLQERVRLQRAQLEEERRERLERERSEHDRAERERREMIPESPHPLPVEESPTPIEEGKPKSSIGKWVLSAMVGSLLMLGGQYLWFDNRTDSQDGGTVVSAKLAQVEAIVATSAASPGPAAPNASSLPVMVDFVTDAASVLPLDDQSYLGERLRMMAESGVKTRIVVVPGTGSESIEQFSRRLGNTWNAAGGSTQSDLLIVISSDDQRIRFEIAGDLVRALAQDVAATLISEQFAPAARASGIGVGLRRLVNQIEKTVSTSKFALLSPDELRTASLAEMNRIIKTVAGWDGKQPALSLIQEASVDSAIARLESMPRPVRGDRKAARQLHGNGVKLIGQTGFETLAVEKLQEAHAADLLDVQILNDLAYAELIASQPASATERLIQTLRLSPTRTSAWINLAESVTGVFRTADEAQAAAASTYFVGYWFSKDRARTVAYLKEKAAAPNIDERIRGSAEKTLLKIAAIDSAASAPQNSANVR